MTTIMYFFWTGFSGVAPANLVNGPLLIPQAGVFSPGIQAGATFNPGNQQSGVYRAGPQNAGVNP